MTESASSAIFQVIIPGDQPVGDPLNLWQAVPGGILFDVPEAVGVVWHAELPSDPLAAEQALLIQEFRQHCTRQALDLAPQMLHRDLIRLGTRPGGSVFSTHMEGPGGAFEVLEQARQRAVGEISFSAQDGPEVTSLVQMFQQFISQVQRIAGQLALVESAIGGNLLGVTRVGWTGGVDTWWGLHAGALNISQHNLVLKSALAMPQNWLRFLSLLTSAVIRISASLALTPYNPLVIWTTWKYVQKILEEFRLLRSPTAQPIR